MALVLAVGVGACGDDDDASRDVEPSKAAESGDSLKGQTVTAVDHAQRARSQERHRQAAGPVRGEDRDHGRRPRSSAGTSCRTASATRPCRARARTSRRRAPRRCRSSRRSRASRTCRAGSRTSAARPRTPRASGRPPQVAGQDGTWAVPWFTEARAIYYRKDVLEKAGVDRGGRVRRLGRDDRDAAGDQGQGAGDRRQADPAVRLAGQEGVRPRPPRDAVRLGRRRGRAVRRQREVDDQLARGRSRASSTSPTCCRRACTTRASSSATARRSRTSSRAAASPCGSAARGRYASTARTDDENWVPAARENVGIAPHADRARRQRGATRSSAART